MRRSTWLTILLQTSIFLINTFFVTNNIFANSNALSHGLDSGLSSSSPQPSLDEKTRVRINQAYGKLPLRFETNTGQTDGQVKFLTRGGGYSMFFTPTESVLVLSKRQDDGRTKTLDREGIPLKSSTSGSRVQSSVIRMQMVGANPTPKMLGEDLLPGKSNYFIGNDARKWRTDIPNYKKIRYQEVYPGIDLIYYGNHRKLEYDFIVNPGADPKAIQLFFEGIESYSIENGGDLVLHTTQGDVIQKKPVIYQEIEGRRADVAGNYIFLDDERVAFHLGDYDNTQPLVIDPVLVYSTFLGGDGSDTGLSIAVDAEGNSYVTGFTDDSAINFPTTTGAFSEAHNGINDVFISKLNSTGSALVYSTFLGGGNGYANGRSIAVDPEGNAYVTGETSADTFPTTTGAFDETFNGNQDVFVTKLNSSGSALVYSTFLGGSNNEGGTSISVNANGNAYVTGPTFGGSTNFPTTPGAFDETHNGAQDVFVTKLNSIGSALEYSTLLGGGNADSSTGIAVDAGGNAYVTGVTNGDTFPTTAGSFDETHNGGGFDVFVSKLNATGSSLVYSTYLGGSSSDQGRGIAVDAVGNVYVTGMTVNGSIDFPTTPGAFSETHNGAFDVFVSKLNSTGSSLEYSTFLGGSGFDRSWGIAVDAVGNVYVTGGTSEGTIDFPTTSGAIDETHNGSQDGFVSKLNATGSLLLYSTFLGSLNFDESFGIAVDKDGNAYVTGQTVGGTPEFPTTPGAFDDTHNGGLDAFVSKIGPFITANAGPNQTVSEGDTVILDGGASIPNQLTFTWTQTAGPGGTLDLTDPAQPTFAAPLVSNSGATLTFELIVNDGANFSTPDSVDIIVQNINQLPIADAGIDQIVEQQGPAGSNVSLNGSGSSDPDSEPLTFTWTGPFGTVNGEFPNVLIPPGVNIVTLVVNDGIGDSAPDVVQLIVQDTTPTVIFDDNMNGLNGTPLDTHVPDIAGSGWSFLIDPGLDIFLNGNGKAKATSNSDSTSILYSANPSPIQADVDVIVDMKVIDRSGDDSTILVFRYQDASNFYGLRITANSKKKMRLYKVVAGTSTLLATSTNKPDRKNTSIKIEARGNALKVYEDRDQIGAWNLEIDTTDSSIPGAGKVGYGLGGVIISTDDIRTNPKLDKFTVEEFSP